MKRKRLRKFHFCLFSGCHSAMPRALHWFLLGMLITQCVAFSGVSYAETALCDGGDKDADIIGVAVDVNTGEPLYCEHHFKVGVNNWRVDYSVEGTVFAVKDLDYSTGTIAPQVIQQDFRTGEVREVTGEQGQWLVKYRSENGTELESKKIPRKGVQVIDAGFDEFVRQQWQPLNAGNNIVFDFVSIPHLKAIALRAKTVAMDVCQMFKLSSDLVAPRCISVEANSGLLRLFVDRLVLLYDEKKRLRVFKGAVNIQSNEKDTQDAIIYYHYKSNADNGVEP